MQVFRLVIEDLTHVGGPMGSEYSTKTHGGLFESADGARLAAADHWARNTSEPWPSKWIGDGRGAFRTDDLGWVVYSVVSELVSR